MYKPDYIISWDFSENDAPVIGISKLYAKEGTPHLLCDVLGTFYERSGIISLQQLITSVENLERQRAALRERFGAATADDENERNKNNDAQ